MEEILDNKINIFKNNKKKFCIFTFKSEDKKYTRRGVLSEVSDKGMITINHIAKDIQWHINLEEVNPISYTFEPLNKEDG